MSEPEIGKWYWIPAKCGHGRHRVRVTEVGQDARFVKVEGRPLKAQWVESRILYQDRRTR